MLRGGKEMTLKGRSFLKLLDFTPEEILYLVDLAAELKRLHLQRFTIKLQKRLAEMFALRSGYDVF